jgi:hypothetical protein
MKRPICIASGLVLSGCASSIAVYTSKEQMPANCRPAIVVTQALTFSPKMANTPRSNLENKVLQECLKSSARLDGDALLSTGFETKVNADGSIWIKCTGVVYECDRW